MFEETIKQLTPNDKAKLALALNQNVSCVVYIGASFVGVNTTAPTGYAVDEIKGPWICGTKTKGVV